MSIETQTGRFNWEGQAAPLRRAATVVCARPAGADGYEVLFMRRPDGDAFAGGQYVFPGGKVDRADATPAAAAATAVAPREAPGGPLADLEPADVLALYRAAAREVWEEVGVLLGGPLPDEAAFRTAAADRARFYEALVGAGAGLDLSRLTYWVNWVTPRQVPMRFDTHFFLALLPPSVAVHPDPGEVVDVRWLHPRQAIADYAAGRMQVMFPTFRSLEQLAPVATMSGLSRFVRSFPKLRVEPSMDVGPDGAIEVRLPEGWPAPGAAAS